MYGARIRQVRKALGYTQQEVAHLLGMDQSTYSRWERGTTAIGAAELERIARVLKMRAETLFGKERLTVAVLTVRTEERIRELERQLAERDAEIKALREQLRRARARRI
jgi:transcriptional regulator with XRE-family HTH domain